MVELRKTELPGSQQHHPVRMADMFDLELHDGEAVGQDRQACCESDDDIIEIDDVSVECV